LFAAARLAQAGFRVRVVEARATLGGGARTEEVTLPGFRHDICSAIHPMSVVSPAFRELNLLPGADAWAWSPIELAHPFDDGSAAVLVRSVDETAHHMGVDGRAWIDLFAPFVADAGRLFDDILRPVRLPRLPGLMARFGTIGLQSAERLAARFRDPKTRAIFAGCVAHAIVPLDRPGTASFGLVLLLAGHVAGWPCARGGSSSIVDALAAKIREAGGTLETSRPAASARDLDGARATLFDVTPRQLLAIAGQRLSASYRRRLAAFRYAPGIFKIDWALDGPVPWRAPEARLAATVHLGPAWEDIARAERAVWEGRVPETPFVIFAQQSLFDPSRAPAGKQTGWAYCHVPHGSAADMTERIEAQVERFAPGFRERILARATRTAVDVEAHNPNMIGGDIGGGANDLFQFLLRPFPRWNPYTTSNPNIYLCSASTPPGGGVHGMCGWSAAETFLARESGDTTAAALLARALGRNRV
ncbi:MAG TPA: NAD(P)/FAD-dependent oxidoreductase, partial [Thermoanaerobaculia bacterium]